MQEGRILRRNELLLGAAVFAVVGALAMAWLQGSGLTSGSRYDTDLTQSPHWFAYHGDAFAADDLLVRYATFNESPVQNALYWFGTLFLGPVPLHKLVGITIFGLTAALFFALTSSISGLRGGVLAALFFIIFPRSAYEIAGGFSKAWAIGLVLVAVYVVESRNWRILVWVMPLAALAYPVAPVLIGAVALSGLLLELPRGLPQLWRGLRYLAVASALGILPLLYKYLNPLPGVGKMISPGEMNAMWERGDSTSYTLPLWQETLSYFNHPFYVYGTVLLLMLSWRRGLVWKRSFSALVIGSAIAYYVADLVVPQLYLPDRYSRYSIAVLLVLWFTANCVRVLDGIERRGIRLAALAAVVVLAAGSFSTTFRPCSSRLSHMVWEDKGEFAALGAAIASLPGPVLIAGHPYFTAEVLVQARRPVLTINRLYHAWFSDFRAAVRERIVDTFSALYAERAAEVNRLAERYGVTHLVVSKQQYDRARLQKGNVYRKEFNEFISRMTRSTGRFVLYPPPPEAVLFEDDRFWLVRLPLP